MIKFLTFFVFITLTMPVLAKPNIFCNGYDSLDDVCQKFATKVYNDYIQRTNHIFKKEQQRENIASAKIETLITYDDFGTFFQNCGENKADFKQANECLVESLQKYVIQKWL